jgi:nucleoside-diphosphate-sugar epimerase
VGASGYVGGRISQYLSQQGYDVIALVRKIPPSVSWKQHMHEIVEGNIQDDNLLKEIASKKIDVVIYTVSLNHKQSEENIEGAIDVNVTPMWKLLEILSQKGLQRFIYFSTQQIYGSLPFRVINEKFSPAPKNNYGLTHLMCENISQLFNQKSNTKCINLRLSNGYGSPNLKTSDCWWLVINDLCKSVIEKQEIRLLSDGKPQRDFIHLGDICQAIEILLNTPEEKLIESNYNVGSGHTYTILELAHIVSKSYFEKFGLKTPVLLHDGTYASDIKSHNDISKFQYSINRIKALGFYPKISLQQGILEIFDYLDQ